MTMTRLLKGVIWLVLIVLTGLAFLAKTSRPLFAQTSRQADWRMAGQDTSNSRNADSESTVGAGNAAQLTPRWTFTADGNVSATPTMAFNAVYFPDWAGNLYAVNSNNGKLIWSQKISSDDGHIGAFSRTSPAVYLLNVIIGDVASPAGASIMAVSRLTGKLQWITQVDDHPAAVITGSPVVVGNMIFVGVSSVEEALAKVPSYPCCSFRGSVVALNANTGKIIWQRYMAPDNLGTTTGYSGNAVWQPPAIDLTRNSLYVGTGNSYGVPASVALCLNNTPAGQQDSCYASGDYYDSALSLNLLTGAVKWSRHLQAVDVWNASCSVNNPVTCPLPQSPDYDLGSGPNFLGNLVGFGQKSGVYWGLNPDTGATVWSTQVGPGGKGGGIQWGTASDGTRIYAAVANSSHQSYVLQNGQTTTGGAWSALDPATGNILWQVADPDGAIDAGSVSVANGVLYVPSASGTLRALNAASGQTLWSFPGGGGTTIDGPSIANGYIYWGTGFKSNAASKVYAFTVPGN
jgi:polyvinyl alcohol dehydrogenase (cytochrome)